MDDNRSYDYSEKKHIERGEYPIVVGMVNPGSRVIDFGCGNGSLLQRLIAEKNCSGLGLELSDSGITAAREKGLQAERRAIDQPLTGINDQSFEFAICNVTLQMVSFPETLIAEMARVARYQIVSFPNFAHYLNRWDLLARGRMPRPLLFGYEWYSTGHIHQLSIRDFEEFCSARGLAVVRREFLPAPANWLKAALVRLFPNLFAVTAIYLLAPGRAAQKQA